MANTPRSTATIERAAGATPAIRRALAARQRSALRPAGGVADSDMQVVLPGMTADPTRLNVLALGDSMMWGQGLARQSTYASLVAQAMAATESRPVATFRNLARSGAQINATAAERERFLDLYPSIVRPAEITAFRAGGAAEALALRLFGEVPATFPTVHAQIDRVKDADAKLFDLVLVDGGANDIEFEEVVNPREHAGDFFQHYEARIRQICFVETLELLRRVRTKFDKATVLFFGYYAPFTDESDFDSLRQMIRDLDSSVAGFLESVADFLGITIPEVARRMRARAMWASSRALFFHKIAVLTSAADKSLPGSVMYVPAGFAPRNAIFAPQPFVFSDYSDPTSDAMQTQRLAACPRLELLEDFRRLRDAVSPASPFVHPSMCDRLLSRREFDGPLSLRKAMQDWKGAPADTRLRKQVFEGLHDEVARIRRVRIASFFHPNPDGAQAIADLAHTRWRTRRLRRKQLATPDGPLSGLARFKLGLDSAPDAVILEMLHVDSISLTITTDADSQPRLACDVFLAVKLRGRASEKLYRLNSAYHVVGTPFAGALVVKFRPDFEPGDRFLYTVDTGARIGLLEIEELSLVVGAAPNAPLLGKQAWKPSLVELSINGRLVAGVRPAGREFAPGSRLSLGYPPSSGGA